MYLFTVEMHLTSTLGQKKKKSNFQFPKITKSGPAFPQAKAHFSRRLTQSSAFETEKTDTQRKKYCVSQSCCSSLLNPSILRCTGASLFCHLNSSLSFCPPPSLIPTTSKNSSLILPPKEAWNLSPASPTWKPANLLIKKSCWAKENMFHPPSLTVLSE